MAAHDPDAAWVQGLVMVAITVVSGADYFLNSQRKLKEVTRARERVSGGRAET